MKKIKKILVRVLGAMLVLALFACVFLLGLNATVKAAAGERILSTQEAAQLENVDCILVLGCGVWEDGTPSHMLEDRLKMSLELYDLGVSDRLLMTGDHGRENYDEVDAMKTYAVNAGIDSSLVFMDHAGFSTYESMYRAREIFQAKKIVIVTQQYHLYRAVYIARQLGMDAYGVAADYRSYSGQTYRDIREILARVKDVGTCILLPEPTYLGEVIPISGDGNLTNDEHSDFT